MPNDAPAVITFQQDGFNFGCPYCEKPNFKETQLRHIYFLRIECLHCGQLVVVEYDKVRKPYPG